MPLIDDRGRVFGKVSLIDALVGLLVLVLIPLAYGALMLFRVRIPKITSVVPAEVAERSRVTMHLTGEDLRPFLHARVGNEKLNEPPGLRVQSPTLAEFTMPDLPPGTYDVALFDQTRELVRKPGAVTVVAPPPPPLLPPPPPPPPPPPLPLVEVQAVGVFVGLVNNEARRIGIGAIFEPPKVEGGAPHLKKELPVAEVLALQAPEQGIERVRVGPNVFATVPKPGEVRMRAIIRLRCAVVDGACKVGNTLVEPNATITLPWSPRPSRTAPASATPSDVKFLIDEVRSSDAQPAFPSVRRTAVATLRVRFVAGAEVLNVMKAGDVDVTGPAAVGDAGRAVLTEIGSEQQSTTARIQIDSPSRGSFQVEQPVLAFTGTVRVPVVWTPSGWTYRDRPVKVGAAFAFETLSGAMTGSILDMKLVESVSTGAP